LSQCLPELDASRERGASLQETYPPDSRLLRHGPERLSEDAPPTMMMNARRVITL